MTKVTIYKNPEKQIRMIQVVGHSESVEEGADLVCCSVSVLTINLVNSLDAFTEDAFTVDEDEQRGFLSIYFEGSLTKEASLLVDSYILGVHSIAEDYGDWLEVDTEEV